MTKRFLPFLLLAFAAIVWASCNKAIDNDRYYSDETRGFYPLQIGRFVEYEVDSITWTNFSLMNNVARRHLNLRYTVSDTFTDAAGRPSFQIDVHQRDSVSMPWKVNTVFYATPTAKGLEVVMQNLRMEKLIFPVREGATWLGNRGIDTTDENQRQFGGWVYRYSNYLRPYNNGRVNFDNTVTITAVNDSLNNPETLPNAYAERNFYREVYGYDVGLIYREAIYWTYDPGNPLNAARKGTSVVMRATQHN